MKLGIHSAPERVSTGSTAGASNSTRPRTGSSTIIADELLDGLPWRLRRRQGRHRPSADVVVDRANEVLAVGEALVEVALGQVGPAADGAHRECRSGFAAEQLYAGGDQGVAAQRVAIFQGDARPASPSLTRLHFAPKIKF